MLKQHNSKLSQFVVAILLAGISGCSTVDNLLDTKNNVDYKNNKSAKTLDFPPDLTAPEFDMAFALPADGVVNASEFNRSASGGFTVDGRQINVLPQSTSMKIHSQGTLRWLEVSAPAEALWPKIRDFWRSVGIDVKKDEPRIGIMETDWAQNRAGLPLNWFNKALSSVFKGGYDAGTRDRYRIRLEKPTAKTTRVFLTHKGAEKVITDTISGWVLVPPKHELEAEMLNRLKAFLQGDTISAKNAKATTADATQTSSLVSLVTQEGHAILQVHDNYKRAWVLTGVMLDRMGLVAEKRNQSAGIYEVIYRGNDEDAAKRGFFKKMFGGRKTILLKGETYQVHIQDAGKLSVVRITDDEGKPLNKNQTTLVLTRLKQEFDR